MGLEKYLRSWEDDPELSNWLVENETNGPYCKWCEKSLTAKLAHLKRHAKTSLHKKNYLIKNGLIQPVKKKKTLNRVAASAGGGTPGSVVTAVSATTAPVSCTADGSGVVVDQCMLCKVEMPSSGGLCVMTERTVATCTVLAVALARLVHLPLHDAISKYGSDICYTCADLINKADELDSRLSAVQSKVRLRFSLPYYISGGGSPDPSPEVVNLHGTKYELVCEDVEPEVNDAGTDLNFGLGHLSASSDLSRVNQQTEETIGSEQNTSEDAGVSIDGLLFVWQDGQLVPVSESCGISTTNARTVVVDEAVAVDGSLSDAVNIVITDGGSNFVSPSFTDSVGDSFKTVTMKKQEKLSQRRNPEFIPRYQMKDCKLTCRLCHYVAATNMLLHKHWNQCHPDKLLPCPCCDKKFFYRTSLNKHMHIHESPSFFCQLCNHPFVNRRDLRRHQLFRHTDLKRFVCVECGHRFKVKFMLTRHLKIVHGIG